MTRSSGGREAATEQDATLTPADLALPGMDRLVAARTVTPPTPEVVARAQAVVRAAMEREARHTAGLEDAPGAAVPVRRRLFRRRWIASAAVVAAAATGIAVLPTVGIGGSKPPASASAATFLNGMADETDAAVRHGHGDATAIGRFHGAPYWKVSYDDATTTASTKGAEWLSRADNVHFVKIGSVLGQGMGLGPSRPEPLYWLVGRTKVRVSGLDKLPTDTAALRAVLFTDKLAGDEWFDIQQLLGTAPISSKLRAALFRVLAQVPGVRLNGTSKDRLGRSGTQISIDRGFGLSSYMLIEPRTATLLEEGNSLPGNPPFGSRLSSRTFTGAGPSWKVGH
ncbi:hypothetical protein AB0M29_00050 [Streptomyces sp. NPDC051976]|uniref:hypothetical protein n=1 Tax=Streptomyces sp. NPDC051976 TaxID=3154947 RepID=UPI003421D7B0